MSKIIIANWKMKLNINESLELAKSYISEIKTEDKEVVICPSEIVLSQIKDIIKDSSIKLGAQNVFWEELGSYTGEISANILEEVGCSYTIIGHSERRHYLLENYEMIHQKLKAVLNHSTLTPVICIGETLKEKEAGKREFVIVDQLQQTLSGVQLSTDQKIIIAYEPIWAIGTGQVIKPEDAENMHEIIHAALVDLFGIDIVKKQMKIIYGGSVNESNIKNFTGLANIDGFLIGGASLEIEKFSTIIQSITNISI